MCLPGRWSGVIPATGAPTSHETTSSLTPRSQACPPSEALSPPSGGTQHGWSLSMPRVSLHVWLFLDLAVLGPGIILVKFPVSLAWLVSWLRCECFSRGRRRTRVVGGGPAARWARCSVGGDGLVGLQGKCLPGWTRPAPPPLIGAFGCCQTVARRDGACTLLQTRPSQGSGVAAWHPTGAKPTLVFFPCL